jgi:SNF2 family DNA or RNA helicase
MDQAAPPVYTPRLPLREKQREGLGHLMDHATAFALFMEMRTGKTATILAEFMTRVAAGELDLLLVTAPAGAYRTWAEEVEKHVAEEWAARIRVHIWSAGATKAQEEMLKEFMGHPGPRILMVNVEALSRVKRARELCVKFMSMGRTMFVVDESTCIKSLAAKRTKFTVYQLRDHAASRRILSGLPSPQSPLDLYSQFEFLDPAILSYMTWHGFKMRYAKIARKPFGPKGMMIDVIVGYKNLEDLYSRIAPYIFRVRLEDCYDLPPKIYMKREIRMTEDQSRIYAEIKKYATAKLSEEQHVTATLVIVQMLRLHQILMGHTTSDTGEAIEIKESRTDELIELLEDQPLDRKVVIWCSYDADIRKVARAIAKRYDSRCVDYSHAEPQFPNPIVSRFWGDNVATREDEEKRFKTDPACRFMVATPDSGGKGRTWDVANLVVYYSCRPNLEHRIQSEERPQNVGKRDSVCYVDFICPGTVEEKFVAALKDKLELSNIITGDDFREWVV